MFGFLYRVRRTDGNDVDFDFGACIAEKAMGPTQYLVSFVDRADFQWVWNNQLIERIGVAAPTLIMDSIHAFNDLYPNTPVAPKFDGRLLKKSTEFMQTMKLADIVLNRPNADPDDDLAVLSRQFLRLTENMGITLADAVQGWQHAEMVAASTLPPKHPRREEIDAALKLAQRMQWNFYHDQPAIPGVNVPLPSED